MCLSLDVLSVDQILDLLLVKLCGFAGFVSDIVLVNRVSVNLTSFSDPVSVDRLSLL